MPQPRTPPTALRMAEVVSNDQPHNRHAPLKEGESQPNAPPLRARQPRRAETDRHRECIQAERQKEQSCRDHTLPTLCGTFRPGVPAFLEAVEHDHQPRQWIGPPPAQRRI